MGILLRASALSVLLITPLACGDDDDGAAKTTPPPPATRSAACTAFQDAACARAEKCGLISGSECFASLRTTFCTSDDDAQACADQLESSTCAEQVPCGETVIDSAPAVEICNQFASAFCDWAVRCDSTITAEECQTEFLSRIDCSRAVGIEGDHEACFDAVTQAECSEEPSLPSVCAGIIRVET